MILVKYAGRRVASCRYDVPVGKMVGRWSVVAVCVAFWSVVWWVL